MVYLAMGYLEDIFGSVFSIVHFCASMVELQTCEDHSFGSQAT